MDDFSDKSVIVYDRGYHQELALRLSRDWGKTSYYKPWKSATPKYRGLFVGDGYPEVKRVKDFWNDVHSYDLFVFPWIYDADVQLQLERMGKRVFGSRKAERYEFKRGLFKRTLEEVGLAVPEYKVITGMKALREFLESNGDEEWIVKMDLLRGDGETFKVDDPIVTQSDLREMDAYYCEAGEFIEFVVEKVIESKIEVGYDGFCIDGQFTDGFVDYEIKNRCCISAFAKYADMSEHVRTINESFAPILKDCWARTFWGTEIRVDDDDTPYFIDATTRMPSPPGELMLEQIDNLSDILYHGAMGDFVQAEARDPIGVELMIYADWQDLGLLPVVVPDEIRKWVKLGPHFNNGDACYMIQNCGDEQVPWLKEQVACVVATGDDIEEVCETVVDMAKQVKGANLEIMESALYDAIKAIKEGQEQGIDFNDNNIPEPETVLLNGD